MNEAFLKGFVKQANILTTGLNTVRRAGVGIARAGTTLGAKPGSQVLKNVGGFVAKHPVATATGAAAVPVAAFGAGRASK